MKKRAPVQVISSNFAKLESFLENLLCITSANRYIFYLTDAFSNYRLYNTAK